LSTKHYYHSGKWCVYFVVGEQHHAATEFLAKFVLADFIVTKQLYAFAQCVYELCLFIIIFHLVIAKLYHVFMSN